MFLGLFGMSDDCVSLKSWGGSLRTKCYNGEISMRIRLTRFALSAGLFLGLSPLAGAVTVQNPADVLDDGSAFVWVEAESVASTEGDPTTGFVVVDKLNPIKSNPAAVKGDLDILPANTNASDGAGLLINLGAGRHTHTATWQVEFTTPATYYLYLHATMFNSDTNTSYGNEDSIFLPPAFGLNPSTDWVGFEGEDQEGNPLTGDSNQDGWMPIFNNKVVMSAGGTEVHNNTAEDFWDGTFHWMFADFAVDSNENGGYIDDYGLAIKYEITEADINKPLDFTISTREHYSVLDGLLFLTSNELLLNYDQEQVDGFFLGGGESLAGDFDGNGALELADIDALTAASAAGANDPAYDVNADNLVNGGDVNVWVKDLKNSWIGDSDLNGEFNSGDFVAVFAAGKYETGNAAVWSEGDWDGNGKFESADFVAALTDGGYENGPRAAVAAVPEPATGLLLSLAGLGLLAVRRRV